MRESLRTDEIKVSGFGRVDVVGESPSTNTALVAAVRADPGAWPAPSALVTEHQTAGRGRAGRSWEAPPRAALTVSVLLRPAVPAERLGWLPLLAGAAVVRVLSRYDTGHGAYGGAAVAGSGDDDGTGPLAVKWPNDVLVKAEPPRDGLGTFRKVAGILTEVVPGTGTGPGERAAVVLGIGLNVSQTEQELPVETATSLALAGFGEIDRTALLVALLDEVVAAAGRWELAGGDPDASGLAAECAAVSATLGTRVRAELAAGAGEIVGEAVRLDATGALVIRTDAGEERTVAAGDVHHLRRS
ncbi:biotin--[acetyl-CoA-carboxylase] ligase [Myceligenerans crystallogenes]|uniref:biotin--[biotin carboxyl-carrier protein] ligase n=1 Tax=Myceligenerans crystallogenes TaxID=316335 RepID=A0ABP4ZIK7_9MICO